jgi:hypothetical protein
MPESPRPIPHPNCYWILPARILAGEYPGARDEAEAVAKLERLLGAGVTSFIDLTESDELIPYDPLLRKHFGLSSEAVHYRRMPIRDLDIPDDTRMREILDCIESEHATGRTVYVHCWGGVGRTGTVVGCYLVRRGRTGDEALEDLENLWAAVAKRNYHPRSPETERQRHMVRRWSRVERPDN